MHNHKKNLSVIFINIDHLKSYNDNYGHIAGDECILKVVNALQKTLTHLSSFDFMARYTWETFAIILPKTNIDSVKIIAEKLRQIVLDLNILHKSSKTVKQVTISLGIATASSYVLPITLIEAVNAMLYKSKEYEIVCPSSSKIINDMEYHAAINHILMVENCYLSIKE